MIAVTGAAGFIGSRLIRHLNELGITDIIAVDDLTDGHKFKNLKGLDFAHYIDKDSFLSFLTRNAFYVDIEGDEGIFADMMVSDIKAIIHLGAISDTTCWDGKKVMENNYDYSVKLLDHLCSLDIGAKFIYASSASVYGNSEDGSPDPLNVYAFSKFMFDKYVISKMQKTQKMMDDGEDAKSLPQIVGLRFFNVYGSMNEWHKENQASPVYKFYHQRVNTGKIEIFDKPSERDFVHVDDVCSVIIHFLQSEVSGIFDVGTGESPSFEDIAKIIAKEVNGPPNVKDVVADPYSQFSAFREDKIRKIPFPEHLKKHYQYKTKANLESLRAVGYDKPFMSIEQGIAKFIKEASK